MPYYPPSTGGASDHGALTGLADDDHTAYATNAEFDDHSARHEDGGADEISIAALSGTPAAVTDHLADTTDAHDASAISFDDTGLTITAADVQTMGEQLDAAISAGGIPATIFDAAGDIIVASAADTAARLAKGADGTFLGVVAGALAYATPAGGALAHDYNNIDTDESTTGTSFAALTTPGPIVTIVVNTKCKVTISADMYGTSSAECAMNMGVALSSANTVAAQEDKKLFFNDRSAGNTGAQLSRVIYYTGLTPGSTVFTAQYYRGGGAGTAHWRYRQMLVECLD